MVMRFFMSVAYHIFHTIWIPTLKRKFDFGPREHGQFMSFIGLSYTLSQGYLVKRVVGVCLTDPKHRPTILLVF